MSLSNLKKNRKSQFDKLAEAAEKVASGNQAGGADDRFWKPTVDKAGNGSAIIRFLPPVEGEDIPFVRYWDHGFQGPGGWYIEKSLTTLGLDDPVSEYNTKLWNSGIEANKDIVRKQKRRLHYVANIYVVSDPGNSDNEGKVFLYEFGKKIFDKINDAMHPQFEDEEPVNPFDLWDGANFRLRIRQVEGYRNYDKSAFDNPTPLAEDDDLETIYAAQHSLQPLIDKSQFKTYEELATKLAKVLGNTAPMSRAEDEQEEQIAPAWVPPVSEQSTPQSKEVESMSFDDDDESLDFFKKLAGDD